ncbi:hypothetical protein [Mycolicibacterium litorale]|nr:hypothetical protein [Mycolicibacterium litorale]MCV7418113.1 hypothetical protein [Mycolicibacterium litorale]TDY06500.1 hypothetical protein BCL50_2825 [Mycolicibacterium litorale]
MSAELRVRSERCREETSHRDALGRVEGWLLHSGIQIEYGEQQGGIAGWLDENGQPDFVYLEIAGYYMTAMAWLASGGAMNADTAPLARLRAQRAAGWVARSMSSRRGVPTRLYLSGERTDWRNDGLFSFDLAMASRGVAATRHLSGRQEHRKALSALCTTIERISESADVMRSHELVRPPFEELPERWSTRSGPHHLKAAAAVLFVPERVVGRATVDMAQRTCEHWARRLWAGEWSCQELHPRLYALEGMLMRTGGRDGDGLRVVERLFAELMDVQASDGTLPETLDGGKVRSDVIAQALRIGLLLRGREYLAGSIWSERLDRLADALLPFVQPDGGVRFARDQNISNTWCAMFAHQALALRARAETSEPVPAAAFELLV